MSYERAATVFAVLLGGALLTFARRYKNQDSNAGYGVAGWAVVVTIVLLTG